MAISSSHQSADNFVSDCDQHTVKFKFCIFSVSSVLAQLQTLNIKKATGPDGISAYFLRSVAEELAEPLTFIFNMSIQAPYHELGNSLMSPLFIRGEVVMIQGILDRSLLFL